MCNVTREVCEPCKKVIKFGEPLLECENCFNSVHAKCYKKSNFTCVNEIWVCNECSNDIVPRYNPFLCMRNIDHNDNVYDDEGVYDNGLLQSMSGTLENCKFFDKIELNQAIKHQITESSQKTSTTSYSFSSFFLNIDGNTTNFDHLLVELKTLNYDFTVIGLAETNIRPATTRSF